MYFQCLFMTVISLLVGLLPNVEGFVIMMTQAITVLYLLYYVLMFVSYILLKYTQPNRPRAFVIPGGMFGAWLVTIVGLIACLFGIVLAIWPPAQVAEEVGSPATYIITIIVISLFVILLSFCLYAGAKHSNKNQRTTWVNPHNEFAPFTWQIEGLSKPGKALSNIPTEILSYDQNPMGTPIKHHFDADAKLSDVPQQIVDDAQSV